MGSTLSTPVTEKFSKSGGNDRFLYTVTEMQGWRIGMEDAHAVVLDLDEETTESHTFFAVYDGHGGNMVAKFAGQNVHKRLVKEESYREKQYETALKRAFLGTDEDLLADPAHTSDPSGCTAVAALLTPDQKIYVANAGDSRSVISIKGEVKPLSYDHKPSNGEETKRISAAGGYIEFGRVNGNLALSRALGDFDFKKNYSLIPEKQMITADPDVIYHEITEEDEFLILACDGIWDCLTSQQVVDIVRYQVSEGKEISDIAEMVCDHCLAPDTAPGAGTGCDNMTILIVAILHGRTKEEWYAWVTDRVKTGYGYETPSALPSLYSTSRLMAFKARRESQLARERARQGADDNGGILGGSGLGGFAKVLGSTGGISFHPGSGIMSDGSLMFGTNEDSDSDDDELPNGSRSFFTETLGLGRAESPDPTKNLKAQLVDFERDLRGQATDKDGDVAMDNPAGGGTSQEDNVTPQSDGAPDGAGSSDVSSPQSQGETSPHSKTLPNGDTTTPVEQLSSQPPGNEPQTVVKVEGLSDSSGDPRKA